MFAQRARFRSAHRCRTPNVVEPGSEPSKDMGAHAYFDTPINLGLLCRHRKQDDTARGQDPPGAGGSPSPADDSPRFVLWITAAMAPRREHCVTFAQVASQVRAQDGVYESICGARFLPMSMTAPPGPRCQLCEFIHHKWLSDWQSALEQPSTLRRVAARLLGRRRPAP